MTAQFLYDDRARCLDWAEMHIANMRFRHDAHAIGYEVDGHLRGVVAYDTFSPSSCMVHIASDGSRRWITREFIVRSFAYPFIQCGFHRITAMVAADNAESLNMAYRFGWTEEGIMREAGADRQDIILFGMLRRECRWLTLNVRGNPRRGRARKDTSAEAAPAL